MPFHPAKAFLKVFFSILFKVPLAYCGATSLTFDPSRRQQANFLRKKLEGEKVEKSESEGTLRGIEDVKSVREHVRKNLVEIDEAGGAGLLKIWKNLVGEIGLLKNKHGA